MCGYQQKYNNLFLTEIRNYGIAKCRINVLLIIAYVSFFFFPFSNKINACCRCEVGQTNMKCAVKK